MLIRHTMTTLQERSRRLATMAVHADELYSLASLAVAALTLRNEHPTASWVIMEVVPSDSPCHDDDYVISTIRSADGTVLLQPADDNEVISCLMRDFGHEARYASQYICPWTTARGIAAAGLPYVAVEEAAADAAAQFPPQWAALNIDDLLTECDRHIPAGQETVLVAPGVGS
ncbi:hypothetical protein [Catellatospora methionotrophica]|uniref:hypothetical protein n=1 Tax=Catellatospora methionotrophica TaxID=121620 RepID=UPI0034045047